MKVQYLMHAISFGYTFRFACAFEDQEEKSLIITGGGDYSTPTNRVTKYQLNGVHKDLPTLKTARRLHTCGMYRNSNLQKVSIV